LLPIPFAPISPKKEDMMFKEKSVLLGIGILFLFFPIVSSAEEKKVGFDLGEIFVTATRRETTVGEVPASVTVITNEKITNSRAKSADELLMDVAGATVFHSSGLISSGSSNKVFLRGVGGQEGRVLVLKDGVPLNDSDGGNVEWNEIAIGDIERIEIVRGASSSLYGSNAMGGVINIITKKPKKKLETVIENSYGNMHTWSSSLINTATIGKFGYYISGQRLESDGYCPVPECNQESYHIDEAIKRDNLSGRFTYEINPSSLLDLSISHYHNEETGKYDIPDFNLFTQDIDRVNLGLKMEMEGWGWQANLYGSKDEVSYDSPKSPAYTTINYTSTSEQQTLGGSVQASINLNDANILTTGVDYKRGQMNRHDDYKTPVRDVKAKGKQEYIAFFLEDELKLGEKWLFTLGGRYDWWKNFDGYGYDTPNETNYAEKTDGAFNPKVGLKYYLSNSTTLRGGVGRAFRAPSLSDLYRTSAMTWTYNSNPDLDPEELISYEIGIDQKLFERALLKATLYQSNAKDFIYNITTDATNYIKQKKNVGKVRMRGIELELDYEFNPQWSFFSNYTRNESEIRKFEDDVTLEGKFLTWVPKHKTSFGFIYDNPKIITARLTSRYKGTRFDDDKNTAKLDDYLVTDLKLSRRIGKYIEMSLAIEDLTNRTYQESSASVSSGRTVMFGVKAQF
jgi:outer membrane receptor protein involved in Fe transport